MATIQVTKYATIEEMKNDNNLIVGEVVEVIGYYMINDGATHKRIISISSDGTGVLLNNSLWANLIYKDYLNVCHLGAKGDGNFDDFEVINQALIYEKNIFFPKGVYKISQSLTLNNHNLKGVGNDTILKFEEDGIIISTTSNIEKLYILGDSTTYKEGTFGVYLIANSAQLSTINKLKIRGFEKGINYRGGNSIKLSNIYLEKNNIGLEVNPTKTQDCNGSIGLGIRAYNSFDTAFKFLKGDSAVGGNFGSSMGNWDISCEGGKNRIFIEGGRYNNFILYSESNSGIEFNIIASGNKIFMRNPDNNAIPEILDNEVTYTSGGHIYKRDSFKLNKIQEIISNDSSVSLQANPIDIFIIKNNNTKTRSMTLQCLSYIPIGTKFEIIVLENNNAGFVLYAPTGYILKGDIGTFGNYVKGLHRLEVYKISNTEALLFRKDTVTI